MKTINEIIEFVNSAEFHNSVYATVKPTTEFDGDAAEINPFASSHSAHNILSKFAGIIRLTVECAAVVSIVDRIDWSNDADELFARYADYAPRWNEYTHADKRKIKDALDAAISLRETVEPMMQ